MKTYEHEILKRLIKTEGGKIDDPDDRGGRTNFGVTQGTLEYLDYKKTDPFKLTQKEAIEIYYLTYWLPNRYDEIKCHDIAERILDIAVHTSAPRRSITANKMLQRAYNDFHNDLITVDGIIGPETLGAVNSFSHQDRILKSLVIQQGSHYRAIVNNDPSQKKWFGGWLNRLKMEV